MLLCHQSTVTNVVMIMIMADCDVGSDCMWSLVIEEYNHCCCVMQVNTGGNLMEASEHSVVGYNSVRSTERVMWNVVVPKKRQHPLFMPIFHFSKPGFHLHFSFSDSCFLSGVHFRYELLFLFNSTFSKNDTSSTSSSPCLRLPPRKRGKKHDN